MPAMQWTEVMSVGLKELDDDHKQIIKAINELEANAGNESRSQVVRQCLLGLRRYAEFHFAREEKVLGVCNFPGLEVQQSEHRDFIDQIRSVSERFDDDPESTCAFVNEELLTFLRDWLTHHILIEDMAYKPYVEKNADAQAAARGFKAAEVWWSQ